MHGSERRHLKRSVITDVRRGAHVGNLLRLHTNHLEQLQADGIVENHIDDAGDA